MHRSKCSRLHNDLLLRCVQCAHPTFSVIATLRAFASLWCHWFFDNQLPEKVTKTEASNSSSLLWPGKWGGSSRAHGALRLLVCMSRTYPAGKNGETCDCWTKCVKAVVRRQSSIQWLLLRFAQSFFPVDLPVKPQLLPTIAFVGQDALSAPFVRKKTSNISLPLHGRISWDSFTFVSVRGFGWTLQDSCLIACVVLPRCADCMCPRVPSWMLMQLFLTHLDREATDPFSEQYHKQRSSHRHSDKQLW